MESKLEKVVYSQNVIEFLTVATDFCNFMDGLKEFGRKEFIDRSLKTLPLLYLKASLLPNIQTDDLLDIEKFVAQEEWQFVNNKVEEILLDMNSYMEINDPLNTETNEPAIATISENFADIYQDMKDFISLYGMGTYEIMGDAIAECKNNFENFWGQSLTNALKAIRVGKLNNFIKWKHKK